jgi:predicted nucleic acid-binding protein
VIYLDSSVVLAYLFGEKRTPSKSLWNAPSLVSSRLLEYEVWNRVHVQGRASIYADDARVLLSRVVMLEMVRPVLARALDPFPFTLRTLDALHLASVEYLRSQHDDVQLASYDERMLGAARALGIPIFDV